MIRLSSAFVNSAARRYSSRTLSKFCSNTDYSVVVVGGGHAGVEAATAAARCGAKTALITQRLDTVGELSCNPSIGGIGKGHLVREIDALDGLMGKVADNAGIHYRLLNRRKGTAVRGPRAQMDRDLYKINLQNVLSNYENLDLIEASVEDLLVEDSVISYSSSKPQVRGVEIIKNGVKSEVTSNSVIITTGTFLRGVLMIGHEKIAGGRQLRTCDSEEIEAPSIGLAKTLAKYDFSLGRLKTGTPARIDGRSIDWDVLLPQPSEIPASPFSHILQFNNQQPPMISEGNVVTCYQTATNEETHKLVLKYENTLPLYDGGADGAGNGPRYCPSLYKKVKRFPERNGHNCFLEPEGLKSNVVYPNGMSGPYPEEIQLKIIRSMKGMGSVNILKPGYDVEYDFVNPLSLSHTLETKKISGLYLAGQICGTTGYEEAASQGLVAGANAGRYTSAVAAGLPTPEPFIIGRDEGYIGVLIDDLVTRGASEPYRMFTSRAEYRITLRADNADTRLTKKGHEYGLVRDKERIAACEAREYMIDDRVQILRSFDLKVAEWAERGDEKMMGASQMSKKKSGQRKTAEEVLQIPHVTLQDVENVMYEVDREARNQRPNGSEDNGEHFTFEPSPASCRDSVEAEIKYSSYVDRQHSDIERWRKSRGMKIPKDLVYSHENFPNFSSEEIEKLSSARPGSFADASKIEGVTPQTLVYLYHHVLKRYKRDRKKSYPLK